jgi:F-type H+-transporting ATPase subunit beta
MVVVLMGESVGFVVQVIGSVLDIRFEDGILPSLYNALTIEIGESEIVAEVLRFWRQASRSST